MRPIHWLFVPLAITSAAFSLALKESPLRAWGDSLFSNLAAGFLASLVTVFFIDRSLDEDRRREQQRFRAIAFRQLRPILFGHLTLICEWYKAVATRKPDGDPLNFHELFSSRFCDELRYLDFSRLAPTAPPISWLEHSARDLKKFRSDINAVIDKYAFFLDPESLDMIDGLATSHIVNLLQGLPNALTTMIDMRRANFTNNFLAGPGVTEHLQTHLELLARFLALYNATAPEPISWPYLPLWRPDAGGKFGSARMSDDQMKSSNPGLEMGYGVPPIDGTTTARKPTPKD